MNKMIPPQRVNTTMTQTVHLPKKTMFRYCCRTRTNVRNAPNFAFEAIIKWGRAAKDNNYSFHPQGGLSRSKNVDILFQSMNNAKQLLPSVQPVPTQNETCCDVITFDFVPQLLRLLQNCRIMTQENLVLDMQNPLQQYKSPNGNIGEALSGSVYRGAYPKYVKHPAWELFVPIIQWTDRTWTREGPETKN